jgi:predicted nuclease with TOPRIM domain
MARQNSRPQERMTILEEHNSRLQERVTILEEQNSRVARQYSRLQERVTILEEQFRRYTDNDHNQRHNAPRERPVWRPLPEL